MMRRSPTFDEIESMFERMARQFDEMGHQFGGSNLMSASYGMDIDVRDSDEEFVVVADLPGLEKDDIDLSVTERTLTISASREMNEETESDTESREFLRRERRHESMHRTIRLPENVIADDATASYTNGVLSVTLPKRSVESDDSHRINIE
ncbi:molecular chaperone [Halogeometricum borinquense DSM 11551]|uniref:Molecular chaperone n=2 Tax=Halogeometricum borinquense TaxID=60847 RepID=E4NTY3_HALBP|nr:Hsp20/alpha crystallin family protein [Halogeometricum borinquense]ADQ68288.1 molecular chaperone (small heat shock protein) [Halogeometricum borinquense DSM 11551]ELY24670.1 molecular chaperone [Halogeometricum borinquense DSM 11551]RYJ12825.1 Hsp20/alpha crystallin family protein [Halogeometricum borinquense]